MLARRLAAARYRRRVALARRTARALARLWRQVDPARVAASWQVLVLQAAQTLTQAQYLAAAGADDYADDVADALGVGVDAAGRVVPVALAGTAADGRDLATLLQLPAITALSGLGRGEPVGRALAAGRLQLDMIARTEVADAGRTADGVAVAARPRMGYVRMLSLPSCARCIILAGRYYRWNAGFNRHPRCDCLHIPTPEDAAGDLRTDPRAAFRSMSTAEQDRVFTAAGAQAIRDGADLARVVNARRGLYIAGGRQYTRESITRRGVGRRVRLTPEQIYIEAGGNRAEAQRLLRLHGYLS